MRHTDRFTIPFAESTDYLDDYPGSVSQPLAERIDQLFDTIGTNDSDRDSLVRRNAYGSAAFRWVDLEETPQQDHHATHKRYVDDAAAAVAEDVAAVAADLDAAESTLDTAAATLDAATANPTPGAIARRDPIMGSLDVGPPSNPDSAVSESYVTGMIAESRGQWIDAPLIDDSTLFPSWAPQSIRVRDNLDGTASIHIDIWMNIVDHSEFMEPVEIATIPSSITLAEGSSGFTVGSQGFNSEYEPVTQQLLFEVSSYDNSLTVYVPADYAEFSLMKTIAVIPIGE